MPNTTPLLHRLPAMLIAAALVLATAACTTAPRQPTLAQAEAKGQLPPLIPVRRFVANADYQAGHVLSPDGQYLLWSQVVGVDNGLAVRPVASASTERSFAVGNQGRGGGVYSWLPDSRHFVYSKDPIGDENIQLWVQDSRAPFAPWLVTPWRGTRSVYLGRAEAGSTRFFFASNQRDKSTLDLYVADAQDRSVKELARSDGKVLQWLIGTNRQLAARIRQAGAQDGSDQWFEVLQADGSWRAIKTVNGFDNFWVSRVDPQARRAWALSNVGRDKLALVQVDLATGAEQVLAQHDQVDLGYAVYAEAGGAPVAYVAEPGYPQITWRDAALGTAVQAAARTARAQGLLPEDALLTRPQSQSLDGQVLVLRATSAFDVAELLLDRRSGAVQRLNPMAGEAAQLLAREEPFQFKASDGLTVHGYVLRPRGVAGPVPLVVAIHGGPWARDSWNPSTFNTHQMLANRGYAVLSINYRGSFGYGKAFMWAGAQEYSGRLQRDIAEGVAWAIDQGIADPQRLAVMGASFGGFSTLMQLIQKPHDYRCGVDVVGVADWSRLMDAWPPFWRNRHMFTRFYGDANVPAERARMRAQSPISQLDAITAPLLVIHGANDVRVLKGDSDDVVAALRARGHAVDYRVFADEGHSIRKWPNRLAMWRQIEDHFATCLGGRSNGFDFYQLMPH